MHVDCKAEYIFPAVVGQDFMTDVSLHIQISASDLGTEVCEVIPTVADVMVEGLELFTVSVVSTDAPTGMISIDPDIQTAVIADNSSEWF